MWESHDEKAVDWNDTFLSEVSVGSENKDPLHLYSDMFSVCHRGAGEIWSIKGLISGNKKNLEMQSFCKGRV